MSDEKKTDTNIPKVLMYSRPGCMYCNKTKTWLKPHIEAKKVVFEDKNIDESMAELQPKLQAAGVMPQTLPIVFVNDKYVTSGANSAKDLAANLGLPPPV